VAEGYTLGIDGGGSKTDAVILDEHGSVVGGGTGGGCNANFTPRRTAAAAYRRAIRAALKEASISAGDITKAGCTFGAVAEEVFAELGIPAKARGFAEYCVAFERAGISEVRGVALTAGTGSSCAALDHGQRVASAGGWGPLFGDEGSAYDIGMQGIKRALLAHEGRAPETALTEAVRTYFGEDHMRGAVGKLFGQGVNQPMTAGFAVHVSKAASDGDQAAIEIIESAGEALGELAAFVARRLFGEQDSFPFVLAGGVFKIGKLVIDPIRAVLRPQFPNARIVVAQMRPGEAVARLAMREE
jgi:N-acetylglucosamine kinase-like BadF-type ATPase